MNPKYCASHRLLRCIRYIPFFARTLILQKKPQENPMYRSGPHTCHDGSMTKAFITKPAPDFEANAVVNGEFGKVRLSDYKGKYVVFFFFPMDFTFVCPTEIIAFSDRSDEFRAINCEVIACSTDTEFCHFAWISQPRKQGGLGEMKIPLLADPTHQISRDYGVLIEEKGVAFRGLFIIDVKGILRQMTINDLPVGRDIDETLRLVQAFQYTDLHGEDEQFVKPVVSEFSMEWNPNVELSSACGRGAERATTCT